MREHESVGILIGNFGVVFCPDETKSYPMRVVNINIAAWRLSTIRAKIKKKNPYSKLQENHSFNAEHGHWDGRPHITNRNRLG